MTKSFDDLITKQTEPGANGVAGLGLFAVNRSGVPYIWKTGGVQSTISNAPITDDSAYFLFSITKTLTAICALQCVERGELALDDAIYDHLPELKDFEIISINEDLKFNFTPHTKTMTLRHLLTHTSGIAIDVFDPRLKAWRMTRGETPTAFCGVSKEAYTLPLVFEPGEGWSYGGGLEWAGILIERLTKMKLGAYMDKYIFEPLGMVSSTFHADKNPEILKNLVEISTRTSDGTLVPMSPIYPMGTEDDSGAMGLVSTLKDMLKVTVDLLQPIPKILKPESVDELTKSQFQPLSPPAIALGYAVTMYGRLIGEEYDQNKFGHGLGAFLVKENTRVMPAGTLTMTGIPNLVWFLNRNLGVGGLYASAMMPPDDEKSSALITAFIHEALATRLV